MPVYEYTAVTLQGEQKKGALQADSEKQLRQKLRAQKLTPLQVQAVNQNSKRVATQKTGRAGQMSQAEMVLFTRQLATLLSSGMPVEEALRGVAEQTERQKIRNVVLAIRARVMEGHSLATGLRDFPSTFGQMYCATVQAGEESGHLDQVLENLADYTETQQAVLQKIKSAAIYPALMIIVSVAIVAFLLAYVVPQLITLFEDGEQALPLITQVVIVASDAIRDYGLLVAALCASAFILVKQLLRQTSFKEKFHHLLLRTPVLGKTIRNLSTARYARTFGILLKAGLPAVEAMQAAANVVSNIPIQKSMLDARVKVKEGNGIHQSLKQTQYFPAMSTHLIASGESGGQLDAMLTKAADTQDRELQMFINSVVSLFEPVMTLVMGGVILVIVLAVLLPIFALSQMVSG